MDNININKIGDAIKKELSFYNISLFRNGGQDSDFYNRWRPVVIDVSTSIKSLFKDIYGVDVQINSDVNYEYLKLVSIYKDSKLLYQSEIKGEWVK